ncbi:hypothetical protein Ga0100230_017865 [Opitutaceae bacterium TAV3]|nr:hypothetical protein Ga0100230_017865 [Opitutaceae bacterium TAV3]
MTAPQFPVPPSHTHHSLSMEILRDQYLDYMIGPCNGRPLFVELFGPLVGLEQEWRAQGATEDEIALTAFGFDYFRLHHVSVFQGPCSGITPEIIEDTPVHQIRRDRYGRRMMLCKDTATIPLPMDHPVTGMDSWLRVKPWYLWNEQRFSPGWAEAARKAHDEGAIIVMHIPGGFDEPRQLLGEEGVCMACYEDEEMLHDMLDTIGTTMVRLLETITREVPVDVLSVHDDMAGKSGPLFGPAHVRQFMVPYYRRCWDVAAAGGARIFQQDSDGDINPIIDALMEGGLNCLYPMEPAAGMDIVATRKKYGRRLMHMGGIDKHVLRQTPEAIRRELDYKLQPLMRAGGMVFGLDHRIPNGTPLANYRYYVKTAREILGLDASPPPGWARAAF